MTLSISNGFANGLCILVFAKKSLKLLFNDLINGLCILVNLANFWPGLTYMPTVYCAWHCIAPCVVPLLPSFSFGRSFEFCTSLGINAGCGGGDLHQFGCGGGTYVMAMDSSFQYVHRVSMVPRVCVLVPAVAWTLESTTQRNFSPEKITVGSTLWVLPNQFCQTIGGNFFFSSLY